MPSSDSLVIIPTYNEKENAESIVRAVFNLKKHFNILIIDDGSPDGTADIIKRLQKEFPNDLHLIEREGKLGLGTAYITGFKWLCHRVMTTSSKWTPTSATIPTTCSDFMLHVMTKEPT